MFAITRATPSVVSVKQCTLTVPVIRLVRRQLAVLPAGLRPMKLICYGTREEDAVSREELRHEDAPAPDGPMSDSPAADDCCLDADSQAQDSIVPESPVQANVVLDNPSVGHPGAGGAESADSEPETEGDAQQSRASESESEQADQEPELPSGSVGGSARPSDPVSHKLDIGEDYFASEELFQELKKDVGSHGEAWFIAQTLVGTLLVFSPFKLQGLVDLVGTVCLTTGVVFIAYALLSLGRNFSPMAKPRAHHSLITTGMYSYARHPMYGGVLLSSLGLAALSRSETRLVLAGLLWWILEHKSKLEEAALKERYPAEYEAYRSRVRKFVPWIY